MGEAIDLQTPPGWKSGKFGDVCRESAFGPRFSGALYDPKGNVAVLRTTDISANGWINLSQMPRARVDLSKFGKHLLEADDLVITRSGRVGTAALFEGFEYPVLPGAFSIRFRLNDRADPRFFRYYFNSPSGQRALLSVATGSVQQNLTSPAILNLEVPIPSVSEQRAIASVLGALDEKIELNRRTSGTLEGIARALFKFWFSDFGPVRAKAEGRWKKGESLPGMPADMWELWTDEFENSEIGEIPKGWRLATLQGVLSELESGSRPTGGASEVSRGGVPSIGAENVLGLGKYDYAKTKYVPRGFFTTLKRGIVRSGDVVLYKDGAQIGRMSYFDGGFPFEECCINEHVFILRARRPITQRYLYFWLDQDWMIGEIINRNSGSAQPGLNQPAVFGLPILLPSDEIVRLYDLRVAPLTQRIFRNQLESRTLGQVRDALLPKLLSGEIRIPLNGGR